MPTKQSHCRDEDEEISLYGTAGTSSLASSIRDVVTSMVGIDKTSTLSAKETMEIMKAEVCTLCKRQNFMDCEGECKQDCDIIHQVLN
jgi:hypothetical protein